MPIAELVPTEQALGERFGVSRITAKRALDELAAEGLVVRQRGRGTTVVGRLPTRPLTANISGLLENLLMLGLKTNVAIVEFGYLVPSEDVRKALDLPEGAEVQRAVRVRSHEGVPLSYSTSFVPAAIGRAYDQRDLPTNALLALLERSGILIGSADQTIGAALADTVVAPLLGVRVGSPLLSITRTVFDQNGTAGRAHQHPLPAGPLPVPDEADARAGPRDQAVGPPPSDPRSVKQGEEE